MHRLYTLGGLRLDGAGSRTLQRKPLAVLALLARAGVRGVSRERVVALLWPEADEEHARAGLRQTLYTIRRALGAEDAILGTTELVLNTMRVQDDVSAFERALATGDIDGALALYHGPFLDGIYVKSSPDFERWVDTQRLALEERYRRAVRDAARAHDARGNTEEAIAAWVRLANEHPADAEATAAVMRARLAAGDPAGAIQLGLRHRRVLEEDQGAQPDAALRQLLQEAEHREASARSSRHSLGKTSALGISAPTGALPTGQTDDRAGRATQGRRLRVTMALAALGIAGSVVASVGPFRRSLALGDTRPPRTRVVVLRPAAAAPLLPNAVDELTSSLPALLATGLDGVAGFSAIDAGAQGDASTPADSLRTIAAGARAQLVLSTTVVRGGGDSVSITASLGAPADLPATALARSTVRGVVTDPFSLADSLVRSLLAQHLGAQAASRFSGTAVRTTSNLLALRAFLAGEERSRLGQHAQAVQDYQRAVAIDSTFALAHFRLSIAADWVGDGALMMRSAAAAVRHSARLDLRDRQLVRGNDAWRRGAIDEAEVAYTDVVTAHPDDIEAWFALAEVQFHSAPLRGRPISAAIASLEQVIALDSAHVDAIEHLARARALAGDRVHAESLYARSIRLRNGNAPQQIAIAAFISGDTSRTNPYLDPTRVEAQRAAIWSMAATIATYAHRPDLAMRALAMSPSRGAPDHRASILWAELAMGRGQLHAALDRLRRDGREAGGEWHIGASARLAVLPGAQLDRNEILALRSQLRSWAKRQTPLRKDDPSAGEEGFLTPRYAPYLDGLLSLRVGDVAAAETSVVALRRLEGNRHEVRTELARAFALGLQAAIAYYRGQFAEALRILESNVTTIGLYEGGEAKNLIPERFLHGRVLDTLGRSDEALRWFESLGQTDSHEHPIRPAATLARARIYDRLGDIENALALYRDVAEQWRDAEPTVLRERGLIEDRIAALLRRR